MWCSRSTTSGSRDKGDSGDDMAGRRNQDAAELLGLIYDCKTMNLEEYRALCATFADYQIEPLIPGFYDHQRFLRAEGVDPAFIQKYARYIESQEYDEAYLTRCRREIPEIARIVWEELIADGRLGACIDIGMILSRILEREGFWNYMVKGSLTISFPEATGHPRRRFYSWDVVARAFDAAHAWIVAPPYAIVDISSKAATVSGQPRARDASRHHSG